jgi:hypothetical protein
VTCDIVPAHGVLSLVGHELGSDGSMMGDLGAHFLVLSTMQTGMPGRPPVARGPAETSEDPALSGVRRPTAPTAGARAEATGRVRVLSRSKEGAGQGPLPRGKGVRESYKAPAESER